MHKVTPYYKLHPKRAEGAFIVNKAKRNNGSLTVIKLD
jgi:hypothetical protein